MITKRDITWSLVLLLSLSLGGWLWAQDRKVAEPDMKVFVDNEYVRVQEHRLAPGMNAAMHSHPCYVIYATTDSTVRFTFPDGTSREATGNAGGVYWHEGGSHAVDNIGDTDVRNIVVEIKNCPEST